MSVDSPGYGDAGSGSATTAGVQPMARLFPAPGPLVQGAYHDLHLATNGTPEQKQAIGPASRLPRPWDPGTCTKPDLRRELWSWLEAVVLWFNAEHTWELEEAVPSCWPHHPHLVHEIAVLADQRRRAGLALSSDPLEDWYRYAVPAFTDRQRSRVQHLCEEGHQPWPGRGRHARATARESRAARAAAFDADCPGRGRAAPRGPSALPTPSTSSAPPAPPPSRLTLIGGELIDLATGELHDDPDIY